MDLIRSYDHRELQAAAAPVGLRDLYTRTHIHMMRIHDQTMWSREHIRRDNAEASSTMRSPSAASRSCRPQVTYTFGITDLSLRETCEVDNMSELLRHP